MSSDHSNEPKADQPRDPVSDLFGLLGVLGQLGAPLANSLREVNLAQVQQWAGEARGVIDNLGRLGASLEHLDDTVNSINEHLEKILEALSHSQNPEN
jgi:ABC-type transporter Mla subunit MlaD